MARAASGHDDDRELDVTYSTYVTNDDPTINPYRVTVIVEWASGAIAAAPNNSVRVQSLFWSPDGCVSSITHPSRRPASRSSTDSSTSRSRGSTSQDSCTTSTSTSIRSRSPCRARLTRRRSRRRISTSPRRCPGSASWTAGDPGRRERAGQSRLGQSGRDGCGCQRRWGHDVGGPDAVAAERRLLWGDRPARDRAHRGPEGRSTSVDASGADTYACPTTGTRETDLLPCAGSHVRQGGTVTVEVPHTHVATLVGPRTCSGSSLRQRTPRRRSTGTRREPTRTA